jgi:tyrosyl-tRNA synthetase
MTNKNYVCTIVAILSIGVLLTYFYQFHVGLSNRQSDWSDFATFFASTLSPVLAESGAASSNGEARRLIQSGAISINGIKVNEDQVIEDRSLIKKGKNTFVLVK